MDDIKKEISEMWVNVSETLFKVFEKCPESVKSDLKAIQFEFEKRTQIELYRKLKNKLIIKCHPEGKHWPPHEECPICIKIFQKIETLAQERCKDSKDKIELSEKFDEIFKELYLTKKE